MTVTPVSDAPNEALVVALARERMRGRPAHVLAARLRLHPSMLSHWAYRRKTPSREQAAGLAELLGEPLADLFPELRNHHDPEGIRAVEKGGARAAHNQG